MRISIIVISLLIVLAVYTIVSRQIATRTTGKLIATAQQPTNAAMTAALAVLPAIFPATSDRASSTLVANVWGRGVMSFEFVIPNANIDNIPIARTALEKELNNYASKENIHGYDELVQPFKITDFWQALPEQGAQWHIDVAFLVNEATGEYIRDLEKLGQ
ncbi:hypothetical protein EQG49_13150 [Periweissella cryptocerci]|uniref:Uncharacterized protein n=1 Tax=Periweissella cryptocerci TaxID=2506420 RepID=A0A4P6YX64_9LACO|nr:hypothetical protein [Periweissella cryptocerci]QBO37343.1 hypothetical protein EQG49_13150 [Periweissella cryptocerci]